MSEAFSVSGVWRYPVKGLGGECLSSADILPERGIAGDRRWMLAVNDASGLLNGAEKWRPWQYSLTLKKTEQLAFLHASLHDDSLHITTATGDSVRGDMRCDDGQKEVENFLRDFLADDSIVLTDCDSRPAWDNKDTPLTVLFSETVSAFAHESNTTMETERFRANIVLDGGTARDEEKRSGEVLHTGKEVKLSAVEGVDRCAATRVNPKTGARDINVPENLVRLWKHNIMGVKCEVVCGGKIAVGDNAFWE